VTLCSSTTAAESRCVIAPDRAFLGHPKGLGVLALTEACERFSYYSMQSLLVLYMANHLLKPGRIDHVLGFEWLRHAVYGDLGGQPLASAIFGTYGALVYAAPVAGGLLADRLLGRRRTIILGAVLMSLGHLLMAFEAAFLLALLCLLLGVGAFKGNIASQVGELYAPDDRRRASAFQIFYVGLSLGVIAAPLVSGTLGERLGWHYGFAAAGLVMIASLAVYLGGKQWLPSDARSRKPCPEAPRKLSREDWRALAALLLLVPVLALALLPNQQIFNTYLLWADAKFDLTFFGRRLPTTWLITLDVAVSFGMLLGLSVFWRRWGFRHHEPDEVGKMILASFFSIAGSLCLAAAAFQHDAAGARIGLFWPLMFHLLNGIAFAQILPIGLAVFSKVAPKAVNATALGFYYLAFFLANALAGWVGTFYATLPTPIFWLIHAASAAGGLLGFLLFRRGRFEGPPGRRSARALPSRQTAEARGPILAPLRLGEDDEGGLRRGAQ
jgi:POT family proton-dependent oligopeptide transporter